ncbi:MAG: hypothetical protein A3J93_01020 [Candidatus Magasanikbacteria bacterium RIFOXYC2_FULL_42_28]|uniref:NAD(P)-binding domain-containing protein n=1 Tax=Candidatus Magasanikbacteria bacterium RIFOXYC2_FULL_42_28 TaxID=1798704 RepID=A0A1F6NXW0_9BACT|nr:MAG: hypothetical protein A3J93_01020 [Candidatus Magasanikbacteria bacterium RIFOXYC2_FULL_42_28]
MNKFLITGFSGFVSRHFVDYLEDAKISSVVLGLDSNDTKIEQNKYKTVSILSKKIDLLNREGVEKVIAEFKPDYILHLASCSSVAFSWENPVLSFQNNTNIFLNLVEAVRSSCSTARILSVGSSEEYGNIPLLKDPMTEDQPLNPSNPYAVARVSQEFISKVYADGFKLNIIMTRSFNHLGPGQKEIFVISSFAKQLCQIKLNQQAKIIEVGDISIVRDFIDVRDVVDAYYKLLTRGKVGDIYNVCSGQGIAIKDIIKIMCEIFDIKVEIKIKNELIRPADNKVIIGSNAKLRKEIGWSPKFTIQQSLRDVVSYWQNKLSEKL